MSDPFMHLPSLRGHLKRADQSELRVTPEVLAMWDERARKLGRPSNWRLTDEQLKTTRRTLLGDFSPSRDLWIYAYGSLMWDPGIYFSEVRLARLDGFERRFNYKTTVGRGSPETPALLLSIERQPGCCNGLAFRIAAGKADNESAILWRREMVRGNYSPALLPMHTPQGDIEALVFTADPENQEYAGELPLDETAAIIANASGPLGSNGVYLEQLSEQLQTLGLEDTYIAQLMAHVRLR
jgi:glutathione-specific gamma-glutamylcyclotransferase